MKNRMQFLLLMAAMMFTGCSQNEEMEGPDSPNGDATTNYLTVNIVAAPNMGTRADDFEQGTENAVTSVRFYFFDASGNAAKVKKNQSGTYDSYHDWTQGIEDAGEDMPNVEKKLATTLIIQSPEGDELPASVVAVINPTDAIKAVDVKSQTALNGIIQNFSAATTNFIMSNSVYATEGGDPKKVEAVDVAGHIFSTKEVAQNSPVNIYVERVLAKVRLGVTIPTDKEVDGVKFYPTGTTDNPQQFNGNDIYVKFLGWNVTATANTSRLMKEINPDWNKNLFGATEPWNYAPYFRSFWAVNPSDMTYSYGTFNKADDDKRANALTAFSGDNGQTNYTYVQENASDNKDTGANPNTPTKVIIAAQLVNDQGAAITFAEWTGQRVAIDNLKALLLQHVSLWKSNGSNGYKEIEESDVEIKTASEIGQASETTPGRYKVYLQLTGAAAALTWYSDKGTTVTKANQALIDLGPTKIWNEGYTYYYFDIRHLNKTTGATTGSLGVVRNHLYNATITSLTGLGTPVYKPGETIYPEKPEDDESYIAAKIEILSWRLVPNDVTLEW